MTLFGPTCSVQSGRFLTSSIRPAWNFFFFSSTSRATGSRGGEGDFSTTSSGSRAGGEEVCDATGVGRRQGATGVAGGGGAAAAVAASGTALNTLLAQSSWPTDADTPRGGEGSRTGPETPEGTLGAPEPAACAPPWRSMAVPSATAAAAEGPTRAAPAPATTCAVAAAAEEAIAAASVT